MILGRMLRHLGEKIRVHQSEVNLTIKVLLDQQYCIFNISGD